MKLGIRLLCIFSLLLMAASCTARIQKSGVGEDTTILLMKKLEAYNDSITQLTGTAVMFYKDQNKTLSFRARVVSRNEDLRLDLNDFVFKKPVLTLIKKGSDILIVIHVKKEFYRMKYDALDLETFAGINIPHGILLPSITGRMYVEENKGTVSPIDSATLLIHGNNMREEIHFNEISLPTVAMINVPPTEYTLILTKFNKYYNEMYFPQKISLAASGRALEISYSEVHINESVDGSSFNIESAIPRGYSGGML